jgi:hypothetical protein
MYFQIKKHFKSNHLTILNKFKIQRFQKKKKRNSIFNDF